MGGMSRQGDRKLQQNAATFSPGLCEFCGDPEPCARRACLDALSALADYWEAEAYPSGQEGIPRSGRLP